MIDAKDLRLGNWVETYMVMDDGFGNITSPKVRHKQIEVGDLQIIVGANGLATYRGIPLTPEILLAVGFEKINSNVPNLHRLPFDKYKQLRWSTIDGLCVETIKSGWLWQFEHIKYLHQLQNLYYSLTGKELTYSPNTK